MAVEDVLDDGEPQTGAALLPARRHADPIEPLGEAGQMLWSDAGPVIRHRGDEAGRAPAAGRLARDCNIDAPTRLAVLDGVLHQVLEHLDDLVAVAANDGGLLQPAELDRSPRLARDRLQALDHVCPGFVEVDALGGGEMP